MEFVDKFKKRNEDFTRDRKLGFTDIIMLLMNMIKKSTQLEIDEFIERFDKKENGEAMGYSKQAFSKARQKLLPEAFVSLNDTFIDNYYADSEFDMYRGYRLMAADGTTIELPNTEETREHFGYAEGGINKLRVARGRASGLYDLANKILIDCELGRYDDNERDLVKKNIEKLLSYNQDHIKNLILFDRGYPSLEFILYLMDKKIDFLMRVEKVFLKEINEIKSDDEIVEIELTKKRLAGLKLKGLGSWIKNIKSIKIRVIKTVLPSGEEEILISSLLSADITKEELIELYFERWSIETKFDELKNKLEIENFTGEKVITIQQDFYASILINNIASMIRQDAEEELQERIKEKELKHEYQINCNLMIGKLKINLVKMLLEDNVGKRSAMYEKFIGEISKSIVPVRKSRSSPRKKGLKSNKYSNCKKRCL